MKGLGMGVHIPVEVEVCTDQARLVPAIFVLLHRAACAFQPLGDYNTPLPVASVSPEEKKRSGQYDRHFNLGALSFHQSYKHLFFFLSPFLATSNASTRTHTKIIYDYEKKAFSL